MWLHLQNFLPYTVFGHSFYLLQKFADGVVVDLFYSAGKKVFVSTKVTVIVSAFY